MTQLALVRFSLLFTIIALFACETTTQTSSVATLPSLPANLNLKLNQIQLLGTHNSYAMPLDSNILSYLDPLIAKQMEQFLANMSEDARARYEEYHPNQVTMSEALAYDHPDFPTQLDAGIRSLELDVYHDPAGGRFMKPAAYEFLQNQGKTDLLPLDTNGLSQAGFKVLHMADVDFRTHYPTFVGALQTLKSWSEAHPRHIPLFIMIEAKDRSTPMFPNPTEVLPFDQKAFDHLDSVVFSILGKENMIIPDDVRGNYATLEEAVKAQNWPLLSESLGKFVFMLLPTTAGLITETPYVNGRPSLEGRAMFLLSDPGFPHSAFLLVDNAVMRKESIQEQVKQGYIVRSRSDIETYEAKVNDMSRAKAAFESGAQVISTDFFRPGNPYGTDYVVELPGGGDVRCNPVNGGCEE